MSVTVKLDPEIRERIVALAHARDRSAHWIMREAIRQYVEREEARERFRRETIEASERYHATGLHLTAEEADAIRDVGRLCRFLSPKNPAAAARVAGTIRRAVRILADHPGLGRPVEELPERFRELVIPFGDGGYLARYELVGEAVVIVAVRHQREVDYD